MKIEDGKNATEAQKDAEMRKELRIDNWVFAGNFVELSVSSGLLRKVPKLMDALAPLREQYSDDPQRYPLDHVIRCFGWAMDTRVFDGNSVPVETTHRGKYP